MSDNFKVGDIVKILREEGLGVVRTTCIGGCWVSRKFGPLFELHKDLTKVSSKPTITKELGIHWCSSEICVGHGNTPAESYESWVNLLKRTQ